MKWKAAIFWLLCLGLAVSADAMSLFGGRGGKNRPRPPDLGPFIMAESEGASWFDVDIDGQVLKVFADEDGEIIVDLKDKVKCFGDYDITLIPWNTHGQGEEAYFHLRVEPLRGGLTLWSIIKDENELEEVDWYDDAFTDELSAIIKRHLEVTCQDGLSR